MVTNCEALTNTNKKNKHLMSKKNRRKNWAIINISIVAKPVLSATEGWS